MLRASAALDVGDRPSLGTPGEPTPPSWRGRRALPRTGAVKRLEQVCSPDWAICTRVGIATIGLGVGPVATLLQCNPRHAAGAPDRALGRLS